MYSDLEPYVDEKFSHKFYYQVFFMLSAETGVATQLSLSSMPDTGPTAAADNFPPLLAPDGNRPSRTLLTA